MVHEDPWIKKLDEAVRAPDAEWVHSVARITAAVSESPRKYCSTVGHLLAFFLSNEGSPNPLHNEFLAALAGEAMMRKGSITREVGSMMNASPLLRDTEVSVEHATEILNTVSNLMNEEPKTHTKGLYISLAFALSTNPGVKEAGVEQVALLLRDVPSDASLVDDVRELFSVLETSIAGARNLQGTGKLRALVGGSCANITSLSSAMLSMGPRVCNVVNAMKELFQQYTVTPKEIAACMAHISSRGWDYAYFADCLGQRVNQDFNWTHILEALITPQKGLPSPDFKLFLKIFERTMDRKMNISLACNVTAKNKLTLLLRLANEGCDFQTERMQDDTGVEGHEAWKSIDFVHSMLLACEDASDALALKDSLRSGPMEECPLILLMSLCEMGTIPAHFADIMASVVEAVLASPDSSRIVSAMNMNIGLVEMGLSEACVHGRPQVAQGQLRQVANYLLPHPQLFFDLLRMTAVPLMFAELIGFGLSNEGLKQLTQDWLLNVVEGETKVSVTKDVMAILQGSNLITKLDDAVVAKLKLIAPPPRPQTTQIQEVPTPTEFKLTPVSQEPMQMQAPGPSLSPVSAGTPIEASLDAATTIFPPEVEKDVAAFMEILYKEKIDIHGLVSTVSEWKAKNTPEYACLIQSIFEELGFISKFPPKELVLTARLFGSLVKQELLNPTRTRDALTFILKTLKKESSSKNEQTFCFEALNCFRGLLSTWPNYCDQLRQIPGLNLGSILSGMPGSAPPAEVAAAKSISELHQHDISTLLPKPSAEKVIVTPPTHVQDKCAFLVNNLDFSKIETSVAELQTLLLKEYYPYFSEYLVVKRISLEPNFHRLYQKMLEMLRSKELDGAVMQASYIAVRTLLASPKITTTTSERSLLKNLGAWIGLQTLAQNKSLLARDINLRELLMKGMEQGKLIAIAPFVSKILEHAAKSKVFRPPNPYIMGMLEMLVDIHQLPDIKLTLRFEVEVLCKTLDQNINDLIDTTNKREAQRTKLDEIRRRAANSSDFHPQKQPDEGPPVTPVVLTPTSQPGGVQNDIVQQIVQAQKQPEDHQRHIGGQLNMDHGHMQHNHPGMQMQPIMQQHQVQQQMQMPPHFPAWEPERQLEARDMRKPMVHKPITANQMSIPDVIDESTRLHFGDYLCNATFQGLEDAWMKSNPTNMAERMASIAVAATKELAIKDFIAEPDSNVFLESALSMVKMLSTQLMMVNVKEMLLQNAAKSIEELLKGAIANSFMMNYPFGEIAEVMAVENISLFVKLACDEGAALAEHELRNALRQHLHEREEFRRMGGYHEPNHLELLERLMPDSMEHRRNKDVIAKFPRYLMPVPLHQRHKDLYRSFSSPSMDHSTAVQEIDRAFEKAMLYLRRHYQESTVFLTLTKPEFANETFSESHKEIRDWTARVRKILDGYEKETLVSVIGHFCKKYLNNALEKPSGTVHDTQNMTFVFHNELCLFVMQDAVKKDPTELTKEVTDRFIRCEHKWELSDAACNLIDLGMMDMPKFDACLAEELKSGVKNAANSKAPKATVDFVRTLVQKCVIEKRSIPQSDFKQTLEILKAVVQQKTPMRIRIPSYVAFQPGGAALREDMLKLYFQLEELSKKKMTEQPDKTTEDENTLLKGLQQAGYLQEDKLDKFLTLLVEISVEAFSRDAAALPATTIKEEDVKPMKTGGRPAAPAPIPGVSLDKQANLFRGVDAVHDLLMRLVKGCSWGGQQRNGSAGLHLLRRVLSVVTVVLHNNHSFHATDPPCSAPWVEKLDKRDKPQTTFYQQPYHRLFCNILSSLGIILGQGLPLPGQSTPTSPTSPAKKDDDSTNHHLKTFLRHFGDILVKLEPTVVPGFAFAWLDLISHRMLMYRMIQEQPTIFLKVLKCSINYIKPALISTKFSEPQRLFYKSLLKIFMVITFDFPAFHYTYFLDLCNTIPPMCFQLRNVVLSARVRGVRLPVTSEMFSIKRELTTPVLLPEFVGEVIQKQTCVTNEDIAEYITGSAPMATADTPLVSEVVQAVHSEDDTVPQINASFNVPFITAFVSCTVEHSASDNEVTAEERLNRSVALVGAVISRLPAGGRYLVAGAIANHLRDPNTHTFFFSRMLLRLFSSEDSDEMTQELIVKVLVERILEHTHLYLWGILGTSTELMKDPKYGFWEKPFVRNPREIEKFFTTLARVTTRQSANSVASPQAASAQVPKPVQKTEPASPATPAAEDALV